MAQSQTRANYDRDLLLLMLIALAVRGLAALPQQQPSYFDAIYYYVNGVNLAEGRGFVEDFIWNYLDQPDRPPQPSHRYWMPLTSVLAASGMAVGGIGFTAAQVPFILLSALLAPISYGTAMLLSSQRRHGWLAGLLAIFSGFYFPFWTATDNFTPFAVAGSLTLILAWLAYWRARPERSRRIGGLAGWRWVAYTLSSGICLGLAHLARADGLLLGMAIILLTIFGLVKDKDHPASHTPRPTPHAPRFTSPAPCPLPPSPRLPSRALGFTLLLTLGYLLVMTPWFIRTWQVTGSPLGAAGTQTIWLTGYDDLFSYGQELSPRTFFAQDFGSILQGRWWALTANLQTVLAVWGMIFLTPLAVFGGWALRRHSLVQLAGLYGLLLFASMTLLFAFPGARGGLFHSGAALLPFIYATALTGLDRTVDWLASRRRHWQPHLAKRVFGAGLILMAVALSLFIYYNRVLKNDVWNSADAAYPAIVAWVKTHDPDATVMIGNPPAYRYHGGGLSVVVPNADPATSLTVARRYQVDYLVLDRNHPLPLTDLYRHPTAYPALPLVQTFGQNTGHEIYVFEIKPSQDDPTATRQPR